MSQRGAKKGRRSDRTSGGRGNKPLSGDGVSHLLTHTSEGVYNNPPLAHTLVSLIGCVVEVQMYNGELYEGILRATSPNMDISLDIAHVKGQPTTVDTLHKRFDVKFSDVVTISAKAGTNPQLDIFKTDTEISSNNTNGPQSRELQPFTDFTDDDSNIMANSEEGSGWSVEEMLAVNKDKFQVSSTYDDELPQYTTPLSRDGENYRKREQEAIQLANEIESKKMYSRHGIDDSGSEEDRWSSVVREPERFQATVVKENGDHIVTTSHVTPHAQAPPTSSPPVIAPPPSTSSPTTLPHSSHTDNSSDDSLLPPAPPTSSQLLSNNQNDLPDNVVADDHKPNEGVTPKIDEGKDVDSHVTIGESTITEDVCVEHSTPLDEVAADQPTPAPSLSSSGGETDDKEEHTAGTLPEPGETAVVEKEQAIKNFKLNPTAKEFFTAGTPPTSSFLPPLSSSTSTAASFGATTVQGSPSGTHYTHTRTHAHTPRGGGGTRYPGNHSPRIRAHTPTSGGFSPTALFSAHDTLLPVSSSYMLGQQPGSAMASLMRPNLVQQGFSQYTMSPNHLIGGMTMSQIIAANPHTHMLAGAGGGQQQFSLGGVMQQHSLYQPTQPIVTPQGVVMPAGQPMYIGGVPLSPQMTAVGMSQVNPAAVGQSLVGTTAASGLQRTPGPYQMQGGSK